MFQKLYAAAPASFVLFQCWQTTINVDPSVSYSDVAKKRARQSANGLTMFAAMLPLFAFACMKIIVAVQRLQYHFSLLPDFYQTSTDLERNIFYLYRDGRLSGFFCIIYQVGVGFVVP